MKPDRRVFYFVALAAVVVALAVRFMAAPPNAKPAPSAKGYYTGMMKSKSGKYYSNEDGTSVRPVEEAEQKAAGAGGGGGAE